MTTREPIAPVRDLVAGVWTEVADAASIARQVEVAPAAPFSMAVKANIGVAGFVRSAACRVLDVRTENVDAPVVAAFRAAGAVVVGMSNMHELAFGITSNNATYGPVLLPGHGDRSAGGSSGGSAAAVASGAVRVALGTDTGGSVSIPASFCGVVGFRPSTGRWPSAGIVGLSWTRDTPGVFTRSVRDAMWVDRCVAGSNANPQLGSRPRIGLPRQLVEGLASETASAFALVLDALRAEVDLVAVDLTDVLERTHRAEMPTVLWESRRLLGDVGASVLGVPPEVAFETIASGVASSDVAAVLAGELAAPVTPDVYASAQLDTVVARARYSSLMKTSGLDALVFPATPAPAPAIDAVGTIDHLGRTASLFGLYTRNTGPGTMLGVPMATIPIPRDAAALPVGLTLQGHRFGDSALLSIVATVERLLSS